MLHYLNEEKFCAYCKKRHLKLGEKMRDGFWGTIKRLGKVIFLIVFDALTVAASYLLALWMAHGFEFGAVTPLELHTYETMILPWVLISVAVFTLFRLYTTLLRYAGIRDLLWILVSYAVLAVGNVIAAVCTEMPTTYFVFGWLFSLLCTIVLRFGLRVILRVFHSARKRLFRRGGGERVMVIGAGAAGHMLIKEYAESDKMGGTVVCVIDDDPEKQRGRLCGVPVVGNRSEIAKFAKRYAIDKIVFCIPSCSSQDRSEILSVCGKTGCRVETVPGLSQLANGLEKIVDLRKVEPQDLLGRDPVQVNMDEIDTYIAGKVVMVTGGGGSIGSELCRQIAHCAPKQLIVFDIYENSAYDIQMELSHTYPALDLKVLIGSVRNTKRLDTVLGTYHPDIVFHAAAHKHVPLMEDSPAEAIKNNVFGTYKLAKAAIKHGVRKFVLISTDKAVNPTNIMGASKRLCEMIVQMMNREAADTDFVAVRFGNVLGSNGSVIPLFEKQIAEGGPVTVTHPDIIRYFMTIPEAVSLVLQAGYYAEGGEIYILDMGQPVKIADMAKNLIRLHGLEPDVDIPIVYTGLRPGEKLFEELLMAEEGLQETQNQLIHIGKPIEMDDELFKRQLDALEAAYKAEADNIKELVAEIVPTYQISK